jgi:heme exporter protein B
MLIGVLLLGTTGIAAAATLTAAIATESEGKGALFTVLTFPVILPLFLMAIRATDMIFVGCLPELSQVIFLTGYDATVVVVASILFDFLW